LHFIVPPARGPHPAQVLTGVELLRVERPAGGGASVDPAAFRRRGVKVAERTGALQAGAIVRLRDARLGELSGAYTERTLRYAVRLLDHRGRVSPLAMTTDLTPLEPPAAPAELTAEATGDGIRVAWGGVASGERTRYNLYRTLPDEPEALEPLHPSPLTETEYLDREVSYGARYVYRVRVVLAEGLPRRESESSAPFEVVAEDRLPPASPRGLVCVQEGPLIRLFWNPSPERDLRGYRVYRSVDGGPWARVGPDPVEQATWVDREVTIRQRLSYHITAVDRAVPPNESAAGETVELEVSAEPTMPGEGG
jgi:hypothetical protein